MSLPAYTVTVTALDDTGVQLHIVHPGLPGPLWPGLVPDLVPDLVAPHPPTPREAVTLLARGPGQMDVRIDDTSLAQQLEAGASWQVNPNPQVPPEVRSVAWSPDGTCVLVGYPHFAELVAVDTAGLAHTTAILHHPGLHTVLHAPDQLVTVSADRCRLWACDGSPHSAPHTPDTITAATLAFGAPVIGTDTGRIVTVGEAGLDLHVDGPITALASDHGALLAAAGGVVYAWNNRGQRIARYDTGRNITALACSADGRIAAGDDRGAVRLWAESAEDLPTFDIAVDHYPARFTAGGDSVLVHGFGGYGWEVDPDGTATVVSDMPGIAVLVDSPSGVYRLVGCKSGKRLHILHRTRGLVRSLEHLPVKPPFQVAFSPSEERLALVRKDDVGEGVLVVEVEGSGAVMLANSTQPRSQLLHFAWLDDDRILAACCNEPNRVWTVSTQAFHTDVPDHAFPHIHPGCGPGRVALSDSKSNPLTVLDADTLAVCHTLYDGHIFPSHLPPKVHVSRDGQRALMCNPFVGAYIGYADRAPWCVPGTATSGTHNNAQGILSPCGRWAAVMVKDIGVLVVDTDAKRVVARWETRSTTLPMAFVDSALRVVERQGFIDIPLDGGPSEAGAPWPRPINPAYGVVRLQFLPDGRLLKATRHVSQIWGGEYFQNARDAGVLVSDPQGVRGVRIQGGVVERVEMAYP